MPLPTCGQASVICEVCTMRAYPLLQLSVRTLTGRFIVVTLCRACHMCLAPHLVATVHQ